MLSVSRVALPVFTNKALNNKALTHDTLRHAGGDGGHALGVSGRVAWPFRASADAPGVPRLSPLQADQVAQQDHGTTLLHYQYTSSKRVLYVCTHIIILRMLRAFRTVAFFKRVKSLNKIVTLHDCTTALLAYY